MSRTAALKAAGDIGLKGQAHSLTLAGVTAPSNGQICVAVCGRLGCPIRVIHADSPATGLQRIAEYENAKLIVVGPSHRSGLGRVRPGSVGEQLLSGSPVPVAIAPRGFADEEHWLGLVASAFDGSTESRLALDWAAQLAENNNSRMHVISIHMPMAFGGLGFGAESVDPVRRRGLEDAQHAALASYHGPVEAIVRDGDPAHMLVEASQQADLLVMGSRGYGSQQAALLGGVSHYVVHHAACPVVIHPRSAIGQRTLDRPRPELLDGFAAQDGD